MLVEVAGSHDECLYTQVAALQDNNIEVLLATDRTIAGRLEVDSKMIHVVRSGMEGSWKIASNIIHLIRQFKPEKVVFNTAQGSIVRNVVIRSLGLPVEFIGIIHTTRKFQGSFTQRWINLKIKKYFFLAKFLKENVGQHKGIRTDYFYALDLPFSDGGSTITKSKRIVIIGGVESRRKDLEGFLNMMNDEQLKEFTFIFLGRSAENNCEVANFKNKLREMGVLDRVVLYPDFVSHELFASEMERAALVLPLIHPGTSSAEQYFCNQIPGAMNVALSWKKPLLLHKDYMEIEELEPAAYYYELSNLATLLNGIDEVSYKKKLFQIAENENFSREFNRQKFIDFLRS